MSLDHGTLNLPLAKRGDIDAQLDAHKKHLAKLAKEESIKPMRTGGGVPHLFKGELPRVFANRTQAEKAAARTGGEAYQSIKSAKFLVRFA
jgi:hypothetical protein